MKRTTLECIAPVLAVLRAHPALREVHLAEFLLDGRDFLHFHEEFGGIFADVRLTKGRVRLPVASQSEQLELLERIDQVLSTRASRVRDRQRWGQPRR